jgi:hypothetical protein
VIVCTLLGARLHAQDGCGGLLLLLASVRQPGLAVLDVQAGSLWGCLVTTGLAKLALLSRGLASTGAPRPTSRSAVRSQLPRSGLRGH